MRGKRKAKTYTVIPARTEGSREYKTPARWRSVSHTSRKTVKSVKFRFNPPQGIRGYSRRSGDEGNRSRFRRRRILAFVFLIGAGFVAVVLGIRFNDYWQAQREYAQYTIENVPSYTEMPMQTPALTPPPVSSTAVIAEATINPALLARFSPAPFYSEAVGAYMKQNKDTVAYLDIPDTNVKYPVVQGKDNEYYLTHTFAKKRRSAGAIFMDAWNNRDFSNFNVVIYGHNMKDGSMFSALREYRHADFLRGHKHIEVTLLNCKRIYKVFAAYLVEDNFDFRGFTYTTPAERAGFIRQVMKRSEIKTNTEATAEDMLLTLVTCAGENQNWYWVVHAVLTEEISVAPE